MNIGFDGELEEFVQQHYSRLVGFLELRTGDRDLAEDLAQDSVLKLMQNWDHVRSLSSGWGWLVTVAINTQISWWRRLRTKQRNRGFIAQQTRLTQTSEYPVEALSLLDQLPEKQRAAVILRYYAGLSVAETAQALGCAEGTVKSATAQARSFLRKTLVKEDTYVS